MSARQTGRGTSVFPVSVLLVVLLPLLLMPLAAVFVFALRGGPKAFWDAIKAPEAQFALRFSLLIAFATTAINAGVCQTYPRVAQAMLDAGWEFMGHAYDQMPIHKVEDQAAMINRSMDLLERFTGKRPVGWLGPGLTQTFETPELLVDAGVKYIGDWVYDDEPTVIRTAKGPLVTLPYTVEINDITMMIVQHHESDYLARRAIDQFDRLYAEGKNRAKIMALAIHPYISGQPHRIKYLEAIYDYVARFDGVLHWNGAEILDWYVAARGKQAGVAA